MGQKAEIFTSAIVVVGAFNPTIFSPDWLARQGLIGEDDVAVAREGSQGRELLISHQVTTFETGWFALQVLQNQFSLTSKEPLSPAVKDLAVGIFQLLPHTPVTAVGMNFLAHYKLSNEQAYHKLGDVLAPKSIWKALYPELHAGLANLTIELQDWTPSEPAKTKDMKRVTLQPSSRIKFGVHFSYNDHRDLTTSNDDDRMPAERMASIVDGDWQASWVDAVRAFDGVLKTALGT